MFEARQMLVVQRAICVKRMSMHETLVTSHYNGIIVDKLTFMESWLAIWQCIHNFTRIFNYQTAFLIHLSR